MGYVCTRSRVNCPKPVLNLQRYGLSCFHTILLQKTKLKIKLHIFSSARCWLNWDNQRFISYSPKFDYGLSIPIQKLLGDR